ncbi:MAG TPA: hypothetical protein VEK76_13775 [Candidatus Binatia bacterium]|nr:hypothetical protein [Candidatus Binatia bacterium]
MPGQRDDVTGGNGDDLADEGDVDDLELDDVEGVGEEAEVDLSEEAVELADEAVELADEAGDQEAEEEEEEEEEEEATPAAGPGPPALRPPLRPQPGRPPSAREEPPPPFAVGERVVLVQNTRPRTGTLIGNYPVGAIGRVETVLSQTAIVRFDIAPDTKEVVAFTCLESAEKATSGKLRG